MILLLLISLLLTTDDGPPTTERNAPPDGRPSSVAGRPLPFTEQVQQAYAQKDVAALTRLLRTAPTREARLLCLYRLYPLTSDANLLRDLPTEPDDKATARELALLSALWGYRTATASPFKIPAYGRRTMALMAQARTLDATEPFVLLVEGQSLLFRPGIFGGDVKEAQERFETLRTVLQRHPDDALPLIEAEVWQWYALDQLGDAGAEPLRQRLRRQDLPPLYRDFLQGS